MIGVTRIAVAGLGTMGRQHVRVLSEMPGVELVAVCDADVAARAWAADALGVPTFADWHELGDDLDGVVNALPTPAHFESTRHYLERGLHVLVEKPIAVTVEEAHSLVDTADEFRRVLMVGHVERFNPAVQALRRAIADGTLGDVVNISARRVGVARPAAPHTDVVVDLAIHDIDVCSFLLGGAQPRLVFAAGTTLGANRLEDHADLVLRFGSAVAFIQANWITPVKIRRIAVTGTSGFAEVDYLTQSLRIYAGVPEIFKGPVWNFFAVAQESSPVDVAIDHAEPLRAELQHFVDCIRDERRPISSGQEAARALEIATAAVDLIRGTVRST